MKLEDFRRNRTKETAEEETEIDPIVEAETIQGKTTEKTTGMVVEITTTETEVEIAETTAEVEIEIEVEEETDLILERNQPRSGSGQRYFDRGETCSFCNRSAHLAHNCFRLENYLKRKGKKIVLQDDDDVEEIAQAVQHLNTKLNSLKVGKSTNKGFLECRGNS